MIQGVRATSKLFGERRESVLVGIHSDITKKFHRPYIDRCERILDHNGIDRVQLDISEIDFLDRIKQVDLFVLRWAGTIKEHLMAPTILSFAEKEMGILCFPDMKTCWCYDDKIREYYLLRAHACPIPQTWIFWDKRVALEWLERATFPLVFKLKSGASSENVVLVKSWSYGRRLVNRMFASGIESGRIPGFANVRWKDFSLGKSIHEVGARTWRWIRTEETDPYKHHHKNYVLFQQFLPNNSTDTRVTVIGNRAFASRRFMRDGDFRGSGSGKSDWDPNHIDLRMVTIAFAICGELKFQCMSFDFLYDEEGQPRITEISYNSPDWTMWMCPGFWDQEMNWHEGHFWPQYCILSDLLKMPGLRQPEMEPEDDRH